MPFRFYLLLPLRSLCDEGSCWLRFCPQMQARSRRETSCINSNSCQVGTSEHSQHKSIRRTTSCTVLWFSEVDAYYVYSMKIRRGIVGARICPNPESRSASRALSSDSNVPSPYTTHPGPSERKHDDVSFRLSRATRSSTRHCHDRHSCSPIMFGSVWKRWLARLVATF
jgi:hypothetical protein